MLKGVFFTLLIAISTCFIALPHLSAQDKEGERVIISEKLGDVIDLEERNKYRFFMATKNFKSAILLKLYNENYAFKIVYLDEKTGEEKIKWLPQTESELKNIRIQIDKIDQGASQQIKVSSNIKKKSGKHFGVNFSLAEMTGHIDEYTKTSKGFTIILGSKFNQDHPTFSIELEFYHSPFNSIVRDANNEVFLGLALNSKLFIVLPGLPQRIFKPYVTSGLGFTSLVYRYDGFEEFHDVIRDYKNAVSIIAGFGMEAKISTAVAFNMCSRMYLNVWIEDSGHEPVYETSLGSVLMLNLGLIFYL